MRIEVLELLNSPDPAVEDKLGLLLAFLAKRSKSPGKSAFFDYANDCSIVCARDAEEARFLLESLGYQKLVELQGEILDGTGQACRLSTTGWSELTRRARTGAESNNVFIAMSFDPGRVAVAEAIARAISASNYMPFRMDQIEHLNRIDDEILSRLRSSKFLVVDLTQQNPGAYFEAGFMLGLGRPVIWICSTEDLENVHFDARQYNIIEYDDNEQLQSRLQLRIEAAIGRGAQS
jgi:nucleoside 2-deoxyribosyltransferase